MTYRYRIGDRVKVKRHSLEGNPRTPAYVRGKEGMIVAVHGRIENLIDHRGVYPPLYTLEFSLQDLFAGSSSDKVWVDIHEEWLEEPGAALS